MTGRRRAQAGVVGPPRSIGPPTTSTPYAADSESAMQATGLPGMLRPPRRRLAALPIKQACRSVPATSTP